jgi:endothelin-converting enzyme
MQMSWQKYFSDAMRPVQRKVTGKEMVVVYAPEYLKNLSTIVTNYTETTEGKM